LRGVSKWGNLILRGLRPRFFLKRGFRRRRLDLRWFECLCWLRRPCRHRDSLLSANRAKPDGSQAERPMSECGAYRGEPDLLAPAGLGDQ
jgi:hypothetical protein